MEVFYGKQVKDIHINNDLTGGIFCGKIGKKVWCGHVSKYKHLHNYLKSSASYIKRESEREFIMSTTLTVTTNDTMMIKSIASFLNDEFNKTCFIEYNTITCDLLTITEFEELVFTFNNLDIESNTYYALDYECA